MNFIKFSSIQKRQLLFFWLLLLCIMGFSQSKFNIEPSVGVIGVGSEDGTNYQMDFSYQTSAKWIVSLKYMYADIEFDDFETDLQSISLGGEHIFNPESNTVLSSLFGFSYVMFNEDIGLEDNNGFGFQFGIKTRFNAQKRLNYGINVISTNVTNSPGSIMQYNVFVSYRL